MSRSNGQRSNILIWLRSILFLLAAAAFGISVILLSMHPSVLVRADATKSRTYSLSPRTLNLLEDLQGTWRIAVVMVESQTDSAVVHQIDEVLQRAAAVAPSLSVERIDPSVPSALMAYEQLLLDLRDREAVSIADYESAIDAGQHAFATLIDAAVASATWIERLDAESDDREAGSSELVALAAVLRLLGQQGHLVLEHLAGLMETSESDPMPDLNGARSVLLEGLQQWSRELKSGSRRIDRFDASKARRDEWRALQDMLAGESSALAIAADRLQRLEPLDYAEIAEQLREGEAAIIIGPERAMAIPASQLFATNLESDVEGVVRMDQRFRGEQLLASAIVSLRNETMPTVIFVHAQEESVLETGALQADVSGVAAILQSARFHVLEWPVTLGPKPELPADAPVAWVVLPPAQRAGFEITDAEKRLLEASVNLIEGGDSILLNLYPSYLPRYGLSDPWAQLLEPIGLTASTGEVLLEETIGPDGEKAVQMYQHLVEFTAAHPIAAALNGQRLVLPLPLPIEASDDRWNALATIRPAQARWLESEWTPSSDLGPVERGDSALEGPVDVLWSLERPGVDGGSVQRLLVAGSGPWLLTNVADVVVSAGGGRMTLLNPGNHELMQAAVAWLSGQDDLVAQGPLSQEVARLRGVTGNARRGVGWLLMLGLPGFTIAFGLFVYLTRRN